MNYRYVIIEHYPEGTTWKHFYRTEQEAAWGLEDLKEAHSGRKYELIEVNADA